MAFMINVSDTVLEEVDLESSLLQVFAGVADAVFGGDSAYIYVCGVQKFENLSKRLSCIIYSLEAGVLLDCLVASLVEGEFFGSIRKKVCVYFSSMGSGNAVRRPDASLLLE
jgi:hypothetical protein